MAQVCGICGKKPSVGHSVSHANNKTKRRWNVNIQAVRAMVDGAPKRIRVCSSCIRSGRITKVPYDHSGAKARRATAQTR